MTKRQDPGIGSAATRFKSGRSGNPKGRPRKPKAPAPAPSPFAILDELLAVHEPESEATELPLEDAMLIKTYQRAITGSRRAWKKIVKMILERHKRRFKNHAARPSRVRTLTEQVDPENALDALEILGIGSRTPDTTVDESGDGRLRLERWAVEAALSRRNFDELSSSDKQLIWNCTNDSAAVRWPWGWRDNE
jgi:Family of unknown function (DUF5681)